LPPGIVSLPPYDYGMTLAVYDPATSDRTTVSAGALRILSPTGLTVPEPATDT
jgi:hypothetical protein